MTHPVIETSSQSISFDGNDTTAGMHNNGFERITVLSYSNSIPSGQRL